MGNSKIDFFLNGDMGLWALVQVDTEDVGLVFTVDDEIYKAAKNLGINVTKDDPNTTDYCNAALAFSIHYPRILQCRVLNMYRKTYNLHPGFLPWGRGYYPIFWAMWENTPAGATLHEMVEKVDKGPIVAQKQVEFTQYETGYDVFLRVRKVEKELFTENYGKILRQEDVLSFAQPSGGTYHCKQEFMELKDHSNVENLDADSLARLSRYLTFPGYTGLNVTIDKDTYEVRLEKKDQ